jgi:hypothetical protein
MHTYPHLQLEPQLQLDPQLQDIFFKLYKEADEGSGATPRTTVA